MIRARSSPGGGGLKVRDALLAGLLLSLTLVVYIPAMQGGFVWDDDAYVTQNPTLRSVDGLRQIWLEPGSTPQYYPLVFTSFLLEARLWGFDPTGYHVVNVLLHSLAALLLWFVLRDLKVPGAWFVAAVFALHPVHVESVAWVTERKNVLSAVFYLGSASCLIRYFGLAGRDESDSRERKWYVAGLLLFTCALLSKTVTASLPAALLLVLWWKRGRIDRAEVAALSPLVVLGLMAGALTAWLERHHVGAIGGEWDLTVAERVLVAGRAIWFYAGKLIWPQELIFNYPRWTVDSGVWWQWLFPLGVLFCVVGLWTVRRKLGRGPLVGLLFFCGTLFPALGFFDVYPFRYSFVADHFQYLASIGLLALLVGATAKKACGLGLSSKRVAGSLGAIVLALLGWQTWHQSGTYRDLETLWTTTLERNPRSWMAHINLGKEMSRQGRLDEAEAHFSHAATLRPDNDKARYDLGVVLSRQGRAQEAIEAYIEALQINPDHSEAHNNLGNVLASLERYEEAALHFSEALRIVPGHAEIHNNLANALASQGRFDDAIESYTEALRIDPDNATARQNLAIVRELRREARSSGSGR
jgi:tetratricopeptide (TPR) repeat protein